MALKNNSSLSSLPQIKTSRISCCTEVLAETIHFEWTINNFSSLQEETGKFVTSPTFSADGDSNRKWCFVLHPRGLETWNKDCLTMNLLLQSGEKVKALFKISVLNADGECGFVYASNCVMFRTDWSPGPQRFIDRTYLLDETNRLLPHGKLTLCCEVTIVNDYHISSPIPINVPECHLSEDLGQLLDGQTLTDFILCADGLELAAHKAILAARSTVFAAMIQHEMEEKRRNRVEIADMDQEVLREMLRYIYTGKVCNMTENMPKDLLAAADKYALHRLKAMCEEHLLSNLSVATAEEMLSLAQKHNADQLEARVTAFIIAHITNRREATKWQAVIKKNPHLVSEIFRALITHQTPTASTPT